MSYLQLFRAGPGYGGRGQTTYRSIAPTIQRPGSMNAETVAAAVGALGLEDGVYLAVQRDADSPLCLPEYAYRVRVGPDPNLPPTIAYPLAEDV